MVAASQLPEFTRISDYLFHWAAERPQQVVVALGEQHYTYQAAADIVTTIARALLAAGVRKGDRVAMLSTPRPEFFFTFLATADIGAIWVGLNPRYTREELLYVVNDCRPKLLISLRTFETRDYADDLLALTTVIPEMPLLTIGEPPANALTFTDFQRTADGVTMAAYGAARRNAGGEEPALIVYTSGTTGAPKGALIKHAGLVYCFRTQFLRMGVEPMISLCNLPINHIGCVGDLCCTPLIGGGAIHFMERFDPGGMLTLIEAAGITFLGQIPTMYQLMAAQPHFATANLSSLRLIVWGGAAMPKDLIDLYRQRTTAQLMVVYGLTEGTGSITYSDADADSETLATTIGKADSNLQVRLVTPEGKLCAIGEAGELQLCHPSVMMGYFNRPEATAAAFTVDGYLHTGDLAVQLVDGNFQLVGRLKEMYKSGGYNIYPREIELCLESHPDVALAAVIGVADPVYGEVGQAFVLPKPATDPTAVDLDAWCRARLANYKIPKQITVTTSLPLLPVGKIDKQALRQLYQTTS